MRASLRQRYSCPRRRRSAQQGAVADFDVDGGHHTRGRRPTFRRAIMLNLTQVQIGNASCGGTHSRTALTGVLSRATHFYAAAQ
eukprot:6185684-Pleurochrysis_carterae.AAC.1